MVVVSFNRLNQINFSQQMTYRRVLRVIQRNFQVKISLQMEGFQCLHQGVINRIYNNL